MKVYVHNLAELDAAAKEGRSLRLEFKGGATTIRRPNGQQVLERQIPKGKALRKKAKKVRREISARMAVLDDNQRAALAEVIGNMQASPMLRDALKLAGQPAGGAQ